MDEAKYILAGIILAASVACTENEEDFSPLTGAVTTRIETDRTKASFDGTAGKLTWDTGDEIAVHIGLSYVTKTVTPVSGTDPAAGHISITEETTSTTRNYYAVYPASSSVSGDYGNTTLSVNLPAAINITDKGDDYSPVPMVAVNTAGNNLLYFRPVGGLVRLTCSSVPKATRTIKVTLDKTITGTFTVDNPSSMAPSISTPGTTSNNYVVFTVAGDGGLATGKTIVLNLPVPCGTYTTYKVETFTTADASGTAVTSAEHSEAHTFTRRHGWKLPMGNVSMILNVTGPSGSYASAGGTKQYTVQSYKKTDSGTSNVAWKTEFYTEEGEKIAKPSWLTLTETGSGSASATSFNATASLNNQVTLRTWQGPTSAGSNNSKATATDLSLQNIYGEPIARSTANCYVVSKPGWYKFPCVYGNAVKNGTKYPAAYTGPRTGNDPTSGNPYLKNFVRHDDNPITDPWIKNNGITISSAALVWQDSDNLIASIEYDSADNGFIYFKIGTIWQGNAVIAAKDSGGNILWSWHIWVIEGRDVTDHLDTKTVYSHPTTNRSVEYPCRMLNVNLGWYDGKFVDAPRSVVVKVIQNETGGQSASFTIHQEATCTQLSGGNLYYQWGRKDPFPGFDENYEEKIPGAFKKVAVNKSVNTLGYAIKNPDTFYHLGGVSDHRSWCNNYYENLWNLDATFDADVKVRKTVYDPCPVGFKIPNRNAFSGFSIDGSTSSDINGRTIGTWLEGFYFKCSDSDTEGIFFPATNIREHGSGNQRQRTYGGTLGNAHHWTAARITAHGQTNKNNAVYFGYYGKEIKDANNVVTGYGANTDPVGDWAPDPYGFSVRPIVDE